MRAALGLALPKIVCIIGSAPSATQAVRLIPSGARTIALNAAATVDRLCPDYHMASDWNTVDCDYWRSGKLRKVERLCNFKPIYSLDLLEYLGMRPADIWPQSEIYAYVRGDSMRLGDVKPDPEKLRPGGTILGEALQLCHHRGVEIAIIAGCDMRGNKYHDGTRGQHAKKAQWLYVGVLNELIQYLKRKGLRVYTLTETALDVPQWRK